MQHEVTSPQRLLDSSGNIAEPGFAKRLHWVYDRADIKAPRWRIKEWDYYYIGDGSHGFAITLSDAGFVSSLSISLLGFGVDEAEPFQMNCGALGAFPLGKLALPPTSEKGDACAQVGNADFLFENDGTTRHLAGVFKDYCKSGADLTFDFMLTNFPEETMVIATPFEKPGHFYYNQKINCMAADGEVHFNGVTYTFRAADGAMGTLDWGRGVWTYDNTWYWGSGQMLLEDGERFGFNIGYGFGDTSAASENMLFMDGTAHKLKDVSFDIPRKSDGAYDYLAPWEFHETDGRFEMRFEPIIDRYDPVDLKLICMVPHQVFGRMSGTAVLDDGREVRIADRIAFAEHVHNKW